MVPSFGIGDIVRLNSGGHNFLVVDLEGETITVAWIESMSITMIGFECKVRQAVKEFSATRACFTLIRKGRQT